LNSYLLTRSDLNEHTCSAVFNAYAMTNRVDLALSTWEQLAARGVDIGAFGSSALMKALARQRDIPQALQVLLGVSWAQQDCGWQQHCCC
jgi:pentatricopeptide repeat protein